MGTSLYPQNHDLEKQTKAPEKNTFAANNKKSGYSDQWAKTTSGHITEGENAFS